MSPTSFSDMRSLPASAAPSLQVLRRTVRHGAMWNSVDGLGDFAEQVVAGCTAASTAVAVFGVRRASGAGKLLTSDVTVDRESGLANGTVV